VDSLLLYLFFLATSPAASGGTSATCVGKYSAHSKITMLDETKVSNGLWSYSNNPLTSWKSVSLASQLLLPEFLVARGLHQHTERGVVVCCQTEKGVQTVKRLIKQLSLSYLLIAVVDLPHRSPGQDLLVAAQELFSDVCRASNTRCLILPSDTRSLINIIHSFRPETFEFAYIDVFSEYESYQHLLLEAWTALRKGGVMLGSRYWKPLQLPTSADLGGDWQSVAASWSDSFTLSEEMVAQGIRYAVDDFGYRAGHTQLLSAQEMDSQYCINLLRGDVANQSIALFRECSPAWYSIKLLSHRVPA
jgi:hypothetical protein